MQDVVIVGATRTAVGKFGGAFESVSAVDLGAVVIREVLERAGLEGKQVDEVIMGNILQAGLGQGPARQAALKAGIPASVPSMTINKLCGSGLKAVHLGAQSIQLGEADVVVAGGMENMTQAPYLLPKVRQGLRMGDGQVVDSMLHDGLHCAVNDYHMGVTAENVAQKYDISRAAQDEYAARSQQRAERAVKDGRFTEEIVPVSVPQRKGEPVDVDTDEYPRFGVTADSLGGLRPAFKKEGSVTAGNASGINDGAAAVVLMSREKADQLGIKQMAVIRSNASAAVDPAYMGIGPVPATQKALSKLGLSIDRIDLIEANEAFAAQILAVGQQLDWDWDKVNVNGGAIALGHPVGASGARILVSLLYEMQKRKARTGLATLCIGGGQGVATVVER